MSTAFHPQTDGASERAIKTVGQILRAFVTPDQTDWAEKTSLVEFAINTSISSSTGYAPFDLTYGYLPRLSELPQGDAQYKGVRDFAERTKLNIDQAHDAIIEACVKSITKANRWRSLEPYMPIGSLAYLSTKNLVLPKGHARKLAPKFIGPYKIISANTQTSTYKLELPNKLWKCNIHPKFHASLLRPHITNDDALFPG